MNTANVEATLISWEQKYADPATNNMDGAQVKFGGITLTDQNAIDAACTLVSAGMRIRGLTNDLSGC